jgi:hypothetical protein
MATIGVLKKQILFWLTGNGGFNWVEKASGNLH